MAITTRMIRTVESEENGIKLSFPPRILVSRSSPTFTMMNLFSNIGGVVGLTLGVSIMQFVQIFDKAFLFSWKVLENKINI